MVAKFRVAHALLALQEPNDFVHIDLFVLEFADDCIRWQIQLHTGRPIGSNAHRPTRSGEPSEHYLAAIDVDGLAGYIAAVVGGQEK